MSDSNKRLHIEELNSKFKNKKVITVNDFYEFYKEVFSEINKKTVSWYIHELKNKKIIRNISRGQYVLANPNKTLGIDYIVITMDVIKSSEMDYNEFNKDLQEKIHIINNILRDIYGYNRRYFISQGDEIQIVCRFDENIKDLLMLTIAYLHPFKVRYGMGIGEIDYDLKENSWEMNGPLFWNARDQLITMKNKANYSGRIITDHHEIDKICNNIFLLVNETISSITDKQWQVVRAELSNYSIQDTIAKIGISKTSYYDRLNSSNYEKISLSLESILDLIKIRRRLD